MESTSKPPEPQKRKHPQWALDGRFARLSCGYVFDDDNAFPEAPHFRLGPDGWVSESEAAE